jgi:ribosomal protein S18 acetylase RimI-like enzyme
MSYVIIREALPTELPAVGDLRAAAYQAGGFLSPQYAPELRALGTQGDGIVLVAVRPDAAGSAESPALAGTIMLVLPPLAGEIIEEPDEAEIRALAVAPDTQGGGVGTALIREALRRATAAGARRAVLCTMPQMRTAHRLYERAGFTRLTSRDWSPRPGTTLLAYARDLAADSGPA